MSARESDRSDRGAIVAVEFFGMASVLCGLGLIVFYFMVRHGARPLSPWKIPCSSIFLVLVGIFTFLRYRWSLVLLDIALLLAALSLTIESITHVSFPWIFISFFFAGLLCLPVIPTLYAWRRLR